jgi:hypothetical protein
MPAYVLLSITNLPEPLQGLETMSRQRSDDDVLLFGGVKVNNTQFDLSDDSTRIASVRITNTIFIVLVVSVVGVRIFARAKYVHNIFMDDGAQPYPLRKHCLIPI